MSHDGQTGDGSSCGANDGLMGYGNGEGFSSCSVDSFNDYWLRPPKLRAKFGFVIFDG